MHALIIVIMSILLLSAVLFIGLNDINIEYFNVKNQEYKINSDVSNLSSSLLTYKSLKGHYLPESGWKESLEEVSRYLPQPYNDDSVWSYTKKESGYYFCLSNDQMDKVIYQAIDNFIDNKDHAYLNESCGANEDTPIATKPDVFPAKAALTYWVKL